MLDIRLFFSIFCAIVAAGVVLIGVNTVFTNSVGFNGGLRVHHTATKNTENASDLATHGKDKTLVAAQQQIAELEAVLQQQSARIAYLEKQRFDLEKARKRRENSAQFEHWYAANTPAECQQPANGELNVACINDKIRKKRQFMSQQN